jgi:DNA-binding winged helix-turn-helix (wHTH) protein
MNMGLGVQPDSQTGADYSPDQDRGGTQARRLCFGVFQLDLLRQRLFKDGTQVKMQGKVYQALIALIETPGEIVTRDALRTRLWPRDTHLNYDANVNTTVNKLRLALGDSSDRPLYIETVPRRGYCLIVPTEFADAPVAAAGVPASGSHGRLAEPEKASEAAKSDLWITLGVIALIVAGMLLGAGITRLWIAHFAQSSFAPWP